MTYTNPIIPGFHPDPSICRAGEVFYLATSSFEYFPGVPIFQSRDLVNWRQIGHALIRKSQLDLSGIGSSQGIYAPTLRYHDGRFYLVTTCVGGAGHFFVTTENPAGPWSEPIFVTGNGFDPDLFFDDDGTVYFTRQDDRGRGILQWKIDIETGELLGEPVSIWKGFEDRYCEGPHVYRIGNRYLLLAAEGGTHTGHMEIAAWAERPNGPYIGVPNNPILSHRGKVDQPIQATGHADIVQAIDGRWWTVFLGIRQIGDWSHGRGHLLGRETFLAPLDWDKQGNPTVNGGTPVGLSMPAPAFCSKSNKTTVTEHLRFDGDGLPLSFNSRGNGEDSAGKKTACVLTDAGKLSLRFSHGSLDNTRFPSFIGRRQEHYRFSSETVVDFVAMRDGEETGIAVIQNERRHYDLVAASSAGRRVVFLRRRIEDLCTESAYISVPEGPLTLKIEGKGEQYTFSFSSAVDTNKKTLIGTANALLLSSESAGGFTGVYIGVFAATNHKDTDRQVAFTSFDYRGEPLSPQD